MENSEENFSSLDVVKKTFSFVWSSKNKIYHQLILMIISSYGMFFIFGFFSFKFSAKKFIETNENKQDKVKAGML